jgi:hypothetical protein
MNEAPLGSVESTEDASSRAEEQKKRGNDLVKNGDCSEAVLAYTAAIELNPKVSAFWLNRSIAQRQLHNWEAATSDAAMAVDLSAFNVKAHYSYALCLQHLKRYDQALAACEVGLALQADNKALIQIQRELLQVKKSQETKRAQFATLVSGYAREPPPRRDSSSSSSSQSSVEKAGNLTSYPMAKKAARTLTEADEPYQELCAAALNGNVDECTRLLESGSISDLEWQTPEDGNTALHLAADAGHEPVVKILLEATANPIATNDFDLKPFHLAAPGTPVYQLLLKITRRTEKEERRRNANKEPCAESDVVV